MAVGACLIKCRLSMGQDGAELRRRQLSTQAPVASLFT
jgi:hypothetical protein